MQNLMSHCLQTFVAWESYENFRSATQRHLPEDMEQFDRMPWPVTAFSSHGSKQ